MFETIRKYWHRISPEYHGVIFFVIALFASNFLWKITISGEDLDNSVAVTFVGIDVSSLFKWGILWFANSVHLLLDFFGVNHCIVNNAIGFSNGNSMHVVAGCTAFKQSFIAFCILALSRGPWFHKLWYIPCSVVVLFGFNILRLAILCLVVRDNVESFDLYHSYVLKYAYYAVVMLLWYFWDERLRFKLS